jgi:hypothetical protein
MEKIHTIMTHHCPHFDEMLAIAMLIECGERMYPGAATAKITFCDAGGKTPDGRSWKKWHEEGTLLIGVGGSCFDEHPTEDAERKEAECAATLVAKHLGIDQEPWLQKLLKYAVTNDTKGGNNPFDLAAMVTLMNKRWGDTNPIGVVDWAIQAILVYLENQINFFTKTKEDFDKCSEVFNGTHRGRNIVIAVVTGDNDQLGAYARSMTGANADVVIQQQTTGNVIITTKKISNINLDEVIKALRFNEMRFKNIPCNQRNPELAKEGVVEGAEEWYYHRPANQILNGSKSAKDVPPTRIYLKTIVKIVKGCLSEITIGSAKQENRERVRV